jgi:hypothetical protein
MLDFVPKTDGSTKLRNEVAAYLYDAFSSEDSGLSGLDRWTQRRVTDENLAKVSLVLEADDSLEFCYQNLIREIDTEAETGIYLVNGNANSIALRDLARDSGISGSLDKHMSKIAAAIFPDELAHSHQNLDLVWVTIKARYDRAKIDATVSEIIMSHLNSSADSTEDMSAALRSLLYTFHEDRARRHSGLPVVLNERSTRELATMISEIAERGGDYDSRVDAICDRAGTA